MQEGKSQGKNKRIRRRIIQHGQLQVRKAKRNRNCPKFILGYCWHNFQTDILALGRPHEKEHAEQSFQITQEWIEKGSRDTLSLANLAKVFGSEGGEEMRRFVSARLLRLFLSRQAVELVTRNRKLSNPVSYLICLQKLTARLPNPALMNKLQFK